MRPVSAVFNRERFVAVGNRLYHSANWVTFHDFLFDYMKVCLGSKWGNAELVKAHEDMHPLVQWYVDLCKFQAEAYAKTSKLVYDAIATGSVAAYLSVAYELFLLDHHRKLQSTLVDRLRDPGQFQGARYELYVAALFVKSAMKISYEDERDRGSTHCEFTAYDPRTTSTFSVEAKSRHRPGFLGFPGEKQDPTQVRLRIGELLNDALSKNANHERIIFIDVNMPLEDQEAFKVSWFNTAAKSVNELEKRTKKPAFIFFTNIPNHYVGNSSQEPAKNFFLTAINKPAFKQPDLALAAKENPSTTVLWNTMNQYNRVPHTFS